MHKATIAFWGRGLLLLQCAFAFTTVVSNTRSASSSWAVTTTAATAATNTVMSNEAANTTKLVFDATIVAKSQPMDTAALNAYFPTRDCRLHILSGGGNLPIHDVPWDDELKSFFYKLYCDQQRLEESKLPPYVHAVETCMQFPGIQIHNTVTVASRFITSTRSSNLNATENKNEQQQSCSYYENFLIAEEKYVTGAAPLVWVYQKLTQSQSSSSSGRTEPSGTAYTKISQDDSKTFVMADSYVSIQVSFPKFLVRILPTSQEKMQAQGSASVQKAISKDITAMLEILPDVVAKYHRDGASVVLQ